MTKNKTMVIALGGNAIQSGAGNINDQFATSGEACRELVKVIQSGWTLILTHGNGPQVGNILRRVELSSSEVYPLPLDICVSDSQGGMGYMLQSVLRNEAQKAGTNLSVATVITRCRVDETDQAFQKPTKPIGSFMKEADAKHHAEKDGWKVVEDSGRGWRRVVPSPWPKEILEKDAIKTLVDAGHIVIACGGGGIPVVKDADGTYRGVEAVIDKDIASALLALDLKADLFVVVTGVDRVKVNFRKPNEEAVAKMTVAEAKKHLADGQFPAGSMGPKIQAAIYFLESGGKEVLITDTHEIGRALTGETGTRIVP